MATNDTDVDVRDGESDMITFERIGVPDPAFHIEQVGDDPDIRYRYEWDERKTPTPEQFERVGYLEVKLVTMLNDLDGEVQDAADEVHDALVNLKETMADARGLDDEDRQGIAMGNLEHLPEVERRIVDD